MSRIILCLLVCVLGFKDGWSQASADKSLMQHFTVFDGLPSNTIYDLYHDSRGYLWIATDKGIAKFNGVKFQVYTTSDGLPDNEIFSFCEDRNGRIWLATLNGELCYYKNDTFHNAKNTPFLKMPWKASFIKTIKVEKDSTVTFVFADQIKFINLRNEKCRFFSSTSPYRNSSIFHITKRSSNLFQLTFVDKIIYMDSLSRIINVNWADNSKTQHLYCQDREYSYDSQYAYLDNVPLLRVDSLYTTRIRPSGKILNRIFWDEKKTFLLTSGGLNINNRYYFFAQQALSSITKDTFGNYWIGALRNGLYKLPKGFLNNAVYSGVYEGEVKYLTNVRNRIFIGLSDNNLYEWQRGKVREIFNSGKKDSVLTTASDPFFFLSDRLRYYNFSNTENVVVDNIDKNGATPRIFKSNLLYSGLKAIFEPEDNVVYLASRYRLHKIDYRNLKNEADIVDQLTMVSDTIFDNRIFCTVEDPSHRIWYSSNRGLFRISGGKSLQVSNVLFKQFAFNGRRLVGYTHDNFLLVDKSVGVVSSNFDTVRSGGCIWNKFYQIDSNHLLLSTNNYCRVLSVSKNDAVLQVKDDLSIPLDAEGIICDSAFCYFFKEGNITSIRKDQLLAKQPPPIVLIAGIKGGERQFLQSPDNKVNDIVAIPYDLSRNITIKFSVLSFNSKNVVYQYAISKNGRVDWVDASDDQVNLVNPGYGSYVIRVRAKTLSSEYSEPKLVQLRILRPYWATWWFIGGIVSFTIIVIVLFVRYRIHYIVKAKARENENKVRYLKSEYKALNALMNPHFIFNTLNNVQGLVNRDDKRAANEYLRIFADLVRQNMHNVSMEMISLEKEMDLVKNYLLLEKLRFKENLHYIVTIDPDVDTSEIMVPPLLIQPIVENSIKHGILPLESASGIVKIDISEKDSILQIRVADNGVGLNSKDHKNDSAHISFGLDNIRRRIEQLSAILNKRLIFEMKEETIQNQRWTVAIIFIPE